MGINVIFNDTHYDLTLKQKENFDRYCKIIQWGRREPCRFIEDFIGLQLTDYQKWLINGLWMCRTGIVLCSRNTGKSFITAPYLAARSLLFPNHKAYIISNTAAQAAETMSKLEQLAHGAIGSAVGLSSVFLENCQSAHANADPFTHGKDGSHVVLFNGSEVTSLPSVPENVRGYRSQCTLMDESAFMPKALFDAVLPFASQNKDFITGKGIDTSIMPKQLPNQNIMLSSASDVNSEMYAQYKEGFIRMLMGDPEFFVCDFDYHISIAPNMNGKPMPPLVSPEIVEAAYKTDVFRAEREYGNIWSGESGPDCLVTRATIEKNSKPYYPVFAHEQNKTYAIAYDPASKVDSSVIAIGEYFRDPVKGLMLRIVNVRSLLEVLSNGEKLVMQRPEQIETLKRIIVDYNDGSANFNAIDQIMIDSGGGGFDSSFVLLNGWVGQDHKSYMGLIDLEDDYMKLRADDYPENINKLKLWNFKRFKTSGYEHCQQMLNQGLVVFSKDLNARNEIEFEEETEEGQMTIRYEKPSLQDMDALIQISICKTELMNMQKQKKPSGNIVFNLSPQAKSKNGHDDHADVIMMLCDRLFELRAAEALRTEEKHEDLSKLFHNSGSVKKKRNPFDNRNVNPFNKDGGRHFNPFN